MPGIRIYCRAEAAKVREQLWQAYDRAGDNSFLFVYPTSASVRAERLTRAKQFGALTGVTLLSVEELKEQLLEGLKPRCISTQELPLLLHFSWRDPALRPDLLSYLQATEKSDHEGNRSFADQSQLAHGILHRLAEELEVLSQAPEVLKTQASEEASEASNLTRFAVKFFHYLDGKNWSYREKLLVELWKDGNPWLALPHGEMLRDIVLDGFWVFTPFEWALLRWFRAQSCQERGAIDESPTLHLFLDFSPPAESERFPHLAELWRVLSGWARDPEYQPPPKKDVPRDSGCGVRLFCDQATCTCKRQLDSRPVIVQAPDREEEVRQLAKQLREMAEKDGSFQGYAVCVPSFPEYLGLIRSTFRQEGIPHRVPFAQPLTLTPIWEFFERLAEVVDSCFAASPQSDVLEGRLLVPLAVLDCLATHPWLPALFHIKGWRAARYRWARRRFATAGTLDELLRCVEEELRHTQLLEGGDENEIAETDTSEISESERDPQHTSETLHHLVETLRQLSGELRALCCELAHDEWSEKIDALLHHLLVRLALGAHIGKAASWLPLGRTADDVRFVTASVARLLSLVRRYHQLWLDFGSREALKFADYLNGLALLVESELVADRVVNELGVQILAPTAAVGESYNRLFLVGMIEGQFPIFESRRTFAKKSEDGLRPEVRVLSEQRYAFLRLVEQSQTVYMSYPRTSQDVEFLPSQFLEEYGPPQNITPTVLPVIELVNKLNDAPSDTANAGESFFEDNRFDETARECLMQLAWLKSAVERRKVPFFTELEGNLEGKICTAKIADTLLERIFSAHQLQDLVSCRLNFFFGQILRIQSPQNEDAQYAAKRGQLVHLILRQFLSRVVACGWLPLQDHTDAILAELVKSTWRELQKEFPNEPLRQVASALEFLGGLALGTSTPELQLPDNIAQVLRHALHLQPSLTTTKGLLVQFVEAEIEREQKEVKAGEPKDWTPKLLEWKFGLRDSSSQPFKPESGQGDPVDGWNSHIEIPLPSVPGAPPSIALRGAIDRVDVGNIGQSRVFGVIDYKTGSTHPNTKDLATRFCAIQLPLYAEVLTVLEPELEKLGHALGECAMLGYYQISPAAAKLVTVQEPKISIASVIEETLRRIASDLAGCTKGHFYPLGAASVDEQENKAKCQSLWWRCPYYLLCCRGQKDEQLVQKVNSLSEASSS
ncbi:MAG: PD-(D/E)XK nuclease family protein [Candidatus Sumerlaeaceae bacterium]